jgi:peptidoglycan/xylan/chitin deacetylase (PgdA/CDA1 family)
MGEVLQLRPAHDSALVVTYHYIRDPEKSPFPKLKALRVSEFTAQLDWLAGVRSPVAYETFETSGPDTLPRSVFLLTFDDGFVDHYAVALPALLARGWGGVFFVAGAAIDDPPRLLNVHRTQFLLAAMGADRFAEAVASAVSTTSGDTALPHHVEVYRYDDAPDVAAKHRLNYEMPAEEAARVLSDLFGRHVGDEAAFARALYLSRPMIREMAAGGMTFGFHTEEHPVLSRLSREAQHQQVARGVALVRELTGQARVPFCYPYGHAHTYNADTLAVLAESGYGMAFTTARRLARPGVDARFEVPRIDTRDLPPFNGLLNV